MARRRLTFALLAFLVASAASLPANAAEEGVGFNAELAGSITQTVGDAVGGGSAARNADEPLPTLGYSLTGNCTFAGILSPTNRLTIHYGGAAVASGPQVPQLTVIKCEIFTYRPGSDTEIDQYDSIEIANGTFFSTATDVANNWAVRAVQVCVSGFALFGPVGTVRKDLPQTCKPIIA